MENDIKIIDMKETISKILYSKTAFTFFCGFTVAMIGFILYYAITGDWSGYSLLDNLPVYCMLAVYFLEFWKYHKTGNASTILMIAQLCCWIITAYNIFA
ncbi:MAG: hypothetical protein IJ394_06780 [Bacteroidales bacterium]|nr:hypothetical protein [Bacteroidales bacterium]